MDLSKLFSEAKERISSAASQKDLDAATSYFIGRKGELTKVLRGLSELRPEERKKIGQKANNIKNQIANLIAEKQNDLQKNKKEEEIDVTAPGKKYPTGHLHLNTLIFNEFFELGKALGFSVVDGPEVETTFYNFDALNTDENHPSRDMSDTFYFSKDVLLRCHTSPVQIRYMKNNEPPIRILAPGRVYRKDSDATHTPMFHQLEGLLVDTEVTMSDLKGTLEHFVRGIFGDDRKIRLRPHHFPFTEPSAEVDISCGICNTKGCNACKGEGWLEIVGSGMVHPNVLRAGGIDPEKYQGFAFGFGIDRIAMLKYGVNDLRLFYDNDLRFTEQF